MTPVDGARDIDSLRLHPDASRVPLADRGDMARLRTSLEENGQQDPIDVTTDGVILDGRTRWTLLRDIGSRTVQVRVISMPPEQQTAYIIDRALARRHLTMEQKRALNDLLRGQVVEVATVESTGQEVRIGLSQTERAAKLGVDRKSVERWDRSGANAPDPAGPTHIRRSGGNTTPYPIHPSSTDREPLTVRKVRGSGRPEPLRKDRPIPVWSRHFSAFCRRSRPEDREFLLRMAREIHAALRQNGIEFKED